MLNGVIFWAAAVAIVVVQVWIIVSTRRAAASADTTPARFHGNMRVELAWTVLPAVLLLGILVYTAQALGLLRSF